MFTKLEVTRMAQGLAAHAGARQALVAENMANADTPGYRARDLLPFAEVFAPGSAGMRATRAGHVGAGGERPLPEAQIVRAESAPNGNSVSLETEMVRAAQVKQQHDLALAVYRAVSDITRASLGRR